MLIDIADITKIELRTLGHAYLRFTTFLRIESAIPVIDPAIFIDRFSSKLNFDDKQPQVAHTATVLVQRMKRDWLQIGRRPSGICGAGNKKKKKKKNKKKKL